MTTLKAATFKNERILLTADGFVSNGYFAVKLETVHNAAMFANVDTTRAFTGSNDVGTSAATMAALAPSGDLVEVKDTGLSFMGYRARLRLYARPDGEFVAFNEKYLTACGALDRVLYQGHADKAAMDAPTAEGATVLIMPYSIPEEVLAALAPRAVAVAA